MTISAACSHCGTTFQLADAMAGKQARCSRCKQVFSIPVASLFSGGAPKASPAAKPVVPPPPSYVPAPPLAPPPPPAAVLRAPISQPPAPAAPEYSSAAMPDDDDDFRLAPIEPAVSSAQLFAPRPSPMAPPAPAGQGGFASAPAGFYESPSTTTPVSRSTREWTPPKTRGRWRDHTHWFLLLALIPLIIDTGVEIAAGRDDSDIVREVESDEDGMPIGVRYSSKNAFLPRDSKLHWLFALVSAGIFATALALFNDDRKLQTWKLLLIGLATGTVGIFLLLAFQFVAFIFAGRIFIPRGIIGLVIFLISLIGFSYYCALDPEMGFVPSFFGFVFGVGLCEELVKAIPIVIYLKNAEYSRWRVAMLVGLASGIGFGVSEGITYSGDMYNGLVGPSIYLVRFFSCVALHSIWAGSVGVLMHHDQETLFDDFDLASAGMFIVKYLSVAMVLHGLYDVLLKQQLPWAALLVALASFGWLAFLVRRSEGTEWSTAMRTA